MSQRFGVSARRRSSGNITNQHKKSVPDIVFPIIDEADIILEILDSRFIQETRNLEIEEKIKEKGKKLIFILNKSDLVDMKELKENIQKSELSPNLIFSCTKRQGVKNLRNIIKIEAKRLKFLVARVGIIGYPNTGKSSIINLLKGKSVARTSPEAGFTKGIQHVRLSRGILLIDTPGIIPSKEVSQINVSAASKHSQIGVKTWDKIKNPDFELFELMKKYPGVVEKHYNIEAEGNAEILIEKLGRKLSFLIKGNRIDIDRTARKILKDWQDGKIKF